jgi:peptide/nickel transport system permease protein
LTVARIIVRRLVQALLVSLMVSTLSFFMMRALPGDGAMRVAAARYGHDLVTVRAADAVRAELKLDRPVASALIAWWGDVLRLNLGTSAVTAAPVVDEVSHQLGYTIRLALASMGVALLFGLSLGVLCGLWPGSVFDQTWRVVAAAIRAVPPFILGLLLILAFSGEMAALPAAGTMDSTRLVLPAITLAVGLTAGLIRVTRDALKSVTETGYFAFARTKGLSLGQAPIRHAVRNAAAPVTAYVSVQLAFLIEGVVAGETLFAWPGIGHALVHAIYARDVPMIQGTVMAMALLFVGLSALADFAILAIDLRRR